jgi:hypothetical protein
MQPEIIIYVAPCFIQASVSVCKCALYCYRGCALSDGKRRTGERTGNRQGYH